MLKSLLSESVVSQSSVVCLSCFGRVSYANSVHHFFHFDIFSINQFLLNLLFIYLNIQHFFKKRPWAVTHETTPTPGFGLSGRYAVHTQKEAQRDLEWCVAEWPVWSAENVKVRKV